MDLDYGMGKRGAVLQLVLGIILAVTLLLTSCSVNSTLQAVFLCRFHAMWVRYLSTTTRDSLWDMIMSKCLRLLCILSDMA